jgi:hypothetical protein
MISIFRLFLIAALFANTFTVFAQSKKTPTPTLAGHWEGTITQDPQKEGEKRIDFPFELDLQQKGEKVTGVAYVHYDKYHAKIAVEGKISKNTYFRFVDSKLIKYDSVPDAEWCRKKGELLLKPKDGGLLLEGVWEGVTKLGNCKPGRITLFKKPPRV